MTGALVARERPADGQAEGALVLLHGRATDEHDLFPLLDELDPERRLHGYTPRAPLSLPPGGAHWYVVPRVGYPDPFTFRSSYRAAAAWLDALPGWRYAPAAGSSQLRALLRARVLSSREAGREEDRDILLSQGRRSGLELAGYRLGATMIAALAEAELPASVSQRDIGQGDLGGAGLWLRAEPDYDSKQADALAVIMAMELLA